MTLLLDGLSVAGSAEFTRFPRIWSAPGGDSSPAEDAFDLAARAGLVLDPWQRWVLEQGLRERPDRQWSAVEVGLVVPRQNGKGSILEARALAGLFLFEERLILHTAHEVKTAGEAFLRIKALVTNTDEFRSRVKRINNTHGEEGIELHNGQRLRFLARSRVAGRGFVGDCVILDEAFELPDAAMAALIPTLSARPNPQIWYTSTPPNQAKDNHARVLSRVRRRGIKGAARLAYMEWSVDADGMSELDRRALRLNRAAWAAANPGLGIRLSEEFTEAELGALSPKDFDVERLGIGDWPVPESEGWLIIPEVAWMDLVDDRSARPSLVAFGVDVSWDRLSASIGVCGQRPDGTVQIELADAPKLGTDWVVPRLVELQQWKPCAVVVDAGGPARSLIPALEEAGVEVSSPATRDVAGACGAFFDACKPENRRLRHRGDPELTLAVAYAQKRPLGDLWAWERKGSPVDMTPLFATTLAMWGLASKGQAVPGADIF